MMMLIKVNLDSADDIFKLNRKMRLPRYENLNFDIGIDKNQLMDGKSLACCAISSAKRMYLRIIGDDDEVTAFINDIKAYI
jgi:hypothetical protein